MGWGGKGTGTTGETVGQVVSVQQAQLQELPWGFKGVAGSGEGRGAWGQDGGLGQLGQAASSQQQVLGHPWSRAQHVQSQVPHGEIDEYEILQALFDDVC